MPKPIRFDKDRQVRIDGLREAHERIDDPADPHCYKDQQDWPCDVGFLLTEVDLLAAEVSRLRQQVAAVKRLADEADDRASGSLRRMHGGAPFAAIVGVAEVRAALAVETDQP